jgi:hypothetical protein
MMHRKSRTAARRIGMPLGETTKRTVRKRLAIAVTASVGMVAVANQANAAAITWGAAQDMAGDTDVLNTGTYFDALNFSGGPITVNDVTFNNAPSSSDPATDGAISVQYGDGIGAYGASFTTNAPSSTAYSNLTKAGAFGAGGSGTVTIGSVSAPLIIGDEYRVESWSYYTGDTSTATTIYDFGDASSVALLNQTGQYAVGTFTADATTQQYTFYTSTGHNFVNDVSVFDTTPVPEPASIGLLALSGDPATAPSAPWHDKEIRLEHVSAGRAKLAVSVTEYEMRIARRKIK